MLTLFSTGITAMTTSKILTYSGIVLWVIAFGIDMLGITSPMTVGIPDGTAILGFLLILFFCITGLILILLGGIIFFIRKRKMNRFVKKE